MKIKPFIDEPMQMIWTVRLLFPGDTYGAGDSLQIPGDGPHLVEFYDPRYDLGPYGQFVSRYYAETLLERDSGGLLLNTGSPDWQISSVCMTQIRSWIRSST